MQWGVSAKWSSRSGFDQNVATLKCEYLTTMRSSHQNNIRHKNQLNHHEHLRTSMQSEGIWLFPVYKIHRLLQTCLVTQFDILIKWLVHECEHTPACHYKMARRLESQTFYWAHVSSIWCFGQVKQIKSSWAYCRRKWSQSAPSLLRGSVYRINGCRMLQPDFLPP